MRTLFIFMFGVLVSGLAGTGAYLLGVSEASEIDARRAVPVSTRKPLSRGNVTIVR